MLLENAAELGQYLGGNFGGDQQRLHRVAGAIALRFGVDRDRDCLFHVGLPVNIDMADAVQMLDHRHLGIFGHEFDQALAAARDHHVHILRHGQQLAHGLAVGGVQHLHRVGGQAGVLERLFHAARDGEIGIQRLAAAAQDAGVAGFQAQRRGVRRYVRARFVDDADHAQRHTHAADLDARRPRFEIENFANRVLQLGDLAHATGHGGNAAFVQQQPIQECRIELGVGASFHVLCVGGQDFF